MKRQLVAAASITILTQHCAMAQVTPPPDKFRPVTGRFLIAPSSSSLAGGSAKLVVGPLSRTPGTYVGDYQIKVFPYFFKNESGRLSIKISDLALRKLTQGATVEFGGQATTNGTGKTRPITIKATPLANDRGALTFAVATINGKLIFNTSYRLE